MDQELIDYAIVPPERGPRKVVLAALEEYLDEHYPYWQGDSSKLPEGMCVEMHPLTQHRIIQDPDIEYIAPGAVDPGWLGRIWLPRKINLDLQPGEWRLVVTTTDVKTGGKLP